MDTILALREKRKNLWESAKNFLDTVRDDNGMVSAEDAARYDKMEEDVVNLGKEIDRLERQQRMDAEMSKPTTVPITEQRGLPRRKTKRKAVHPTLTGKPSGTASVIRTLSMCRMP
ncbi:hypothetical protein [Megasphaera elsdenii]|uniref:hypothetical protein n=1 Tax=Megasphaera elsdenii TaxID=907 RepID=UPI00266F5059|nr:hypothetical protein [Megasphaera elsdenii]